MARRWRSEPNGHGDLARVDGRMDGSSSRVLSIRINGESRDIASGTSVAQLLQDLGLQPRYLAVERNREVVPRAQHAQCVLQAGDDIEIVTLVGGG